MASLSIGIVGLPNVGKSTLFNALTKNQVLAANYPFATIEPNTGIVNLPDSRLEVLAKISSSKKLVPATVSFTDVAGLVKDAHQGAGLGNKFLSHIAGVAAIAQIVRVFADENVTHVENRVKPQGDIVILNTELALADLKTIENKLAKLQTEQKKSSEFNDDIKALNAAEKLLNDGKLLYQNIHNPSAILDQLQLLTNKPMIYIFNLDESDLANKDKANQLAEAIKPAPALFVSAKLEDQLKDLSDQEAQELLLSLNQASSGLEQVIKSCFKILSLQTFFTSGPEESRAWTIKIGATAPEAAGVIHTDFEHGFIRAEVVNCEDFITSGSWTGAKTKGKIRSEGKDYIVQDGDVIIFRFNV